MKQLAYRLTVFINISLKILLLFILTGSFVMCIAVFIKLSGWELIKVLFIGLPGIMAIFGMLYLFYRYLKNEKSGVKAASAILITAIALRLIWILLVDTQPVSDFLTVYSSGKQFANGEYWMFKGTSYMARFPHLTLLTIYLGLFQKIFANALFAIKLANVFFSAVNVYIIYLIGTELYGDRQKGAGAAFLAAIFPPFIIYNSVLCSENIAMPFFLGSLYVFIQVVKEKKSSYWLLLSGFFLSLGNLFRMVAPVIVVAYLLYLFIYRTKKKFVRNCILILLAFFIPLYVTSSVLMTSGITENPLWKGKEPSITSVLKGTNIASLGRWNEEDSKIPALYNFDYPAVKAAAKAIIVDRLTSTPLYQLVLFYIVKFTAQWSLGDFFAVSWAVGEFGILSTAASFGTLVFLFSQLLFTAVILLTYLGLFNDRQYVQNQAINLLYIIFGGFGILYLITEQQPRYGYIISWVFVLLAFSPTGKNKNSPTES